MGRLHIEFIQSLDVPKQEIAEGSFAGAARRLLSEDDETGAYTALVSLRSGWSGELAGFSRPLELFGLRGELEIDGRRLGPGCYVYVPSGSGASLAARELAHALVMVEPTRGVDVGARAELYRAMRRLASEGVAIVVATSDYEEVVQVADRALVMAGGRVVCELGFDEITTSRLLEAAGG